MAISRVIGLLSCLLACGCAHIGLLYTDEIRPATRDFKRTPVCSTNCLVKIYRVREPVTRAGLSASWSRSDVKEAAASVGITNLHFADARTRSILFGIFSQRTLIIHGE